MMIQGTLVYLKNLIKLYSLLNCVYKYRFTKSGLPLRQDSGASGYSR